MRYAKSTDKLWVANNIQSLKKTKKLAISLHLARQMEDAGYIKAVYAKGPSGRRRKNYVPDEKGIRLLESIQKFN